MLIQLVVTICSCKEIISFLTINFYLNHTFGIKRQIVHPFNEIPYFFKLT